MSPVALLWPLLMDASETFTPPQTWDFDDGSFSGFTILNTDGGMNEWNINGFELNCMMLTTGLDTPDDWLITPPLYLQAGKVYDFGFDAYHGFWAMGTLMSVGGKEKLEVKYGNGNTVDDMTQVLIEPVEVSETEHLSGKLIPVSDGVYYIGIHCISDSPDRQWVSVDNICVQAGIAASRPGSCTGLEVIPDFDGKGEVSITFKSPEKDISGNPLDSDLTKIEINRDGELIETIMSPGKGESLSHTDKDVPMGDHTYSVTAFNAAGAGDAVSSVVTVGPRVPAAPTAATLVETDDGIVTVTWDPVTTDDKGVSMNPDLISYKVWLITADNRSSSAGTGISGCSYSFDTKLPAQSLVRCAVVAATDAGDSQETLSDVIIAGPSYPTPFYESFAGGEMNHVFIAEQINGYAEWSLMTESSGIPSQDDDDGFIVMYSDPGESASITSGKIDLSGLDSPCLSFYAYNIARYAPKYNDDNEVTVSIRQPGGEFSDLRTVVMSELGDSEGWYKVNVPLGDYAGKKIVVRFTGVGHGMTYTLLDNVRIESIPEFDLNARSISAPLKVTAGTDFNVDVTVENTGSGIADDYKVILYSDGVAVAETQGKEILSGASSTVRFGMTLHPLAEKPVEYYACIVWDSDVDGSNDRTSAIEIETILSGLPYVNDLKVDYSSGTVLNWSEPDLSLAGDEYVTETFEQCEPWESAVDGWSFVDKDNGYVEGVIDVEFPGIEYGSKQSWFVVDAAELDPVRFAAYSGDKYLGQLYALSDLETRTPVQCDDWAISPLLSGQPQEITLWARSLNMQVRESFEIRCSFTGTEPADFVLIDEFTEVPASWKQYSFRLPEGAKYFAIRARSEYCMMLLIDDVTYLRAVDTDRLVLKGYNVYRGMEKLNDDVITAREFTDTTTGDGDYTVTAVYEQGESRASNKVTIAGVEMAHAASVRIYGTCGHIAVDGAEGRTIQVFSVDGKAVRQIAGSGSDRIDIVPGVYVVHVDGIVSKVAVN